MTQRFKYYMHDNCDTMERIHNIESQGVTLTPAQKDNLGEPFYEVCLDCEVNDAGDVKILGVIPRK